MGLGREQWVPTSPHQCWGFPLPGFGDRSPPAATRFPAGGPPEGGASEREALPEASGSHGQAGTDRQSSSLLSLVGVDGYALQIF